ncbi:aminoglycoside phosphotransferase family protein [Epibacterium ulvae]|uniref:aminoglycoside phosphotransferase family protein n=1 Tax=Epibacterium ulvae TaxID=1156985 RepID=UPI002491D86C|nr:phosphotransferase [Epibacterium ulvae]
MGSLDRAGHIMTDRNHLKRNFLETTPWREAIPSYLAGDASNRSYERLQLGATTAVLMDAPPKHGEDIRPFVKIAQHLVKHGFSAPRILAEDPDNGFLLLEDLGDARFKEVIENDETKELHLYTAATEALIALRNTPLPAGLATYDAHHLTQMCDLAFTHYRTPLWGSDPALWQLFTETFQPLMEQTTVAPKVLAQRDFHAENLIWLPERSGKANVGLLDFQDAFAGHAAYDLVSLLQDARRDVSPTLERQMITHYIAQTGIEAQSFETAYWRLGVQRNIRIMGVFARLSQQYNKPKYLQFIPRVWRYICRGLDQPALHPIADILRVALPEPTPETLEKLQP